MPKQKTVQNIMSDATKEIKVLIERREKEIEDNDKKSYQLRHTKDWSGDKWKNVVIDHYKKLHAEFKILKSINHSIGIEIINPVDTTYFRCYSILTPWVLDPVIEFMVDLDEKQEKTAKMFYLTRVEALTNEKTRWIRAGTSLLSDHSPTQLIKIGTHWANDMVYDGFRVIFAHTHL